MKILSNAFKVILILAVVFSTSTSFYLLYKYNNVPVEPVSPVPQTTVAKDPSSEVVLTEYATKKYVDDLVADINIPESSPSETKTVTVTKTVAAPKSPETSYLPITGGFSTKSLIWMDVPGTDFYLDLVADYGENAIVTWDAFIYEEHGNGLVEVRIYDATHGIVVQNSEISTNNASSSLVSSANLAIWRGKNLYKVQIKSQKGFYVFFDSGRLKISS